MGMMGNGHAQVSRAIFVQHVPAEATYEELFDAVGCHFDPRFFHRRCRPLLRAWAHAEALPRPQLPTPAPLPSVLFLPVSERSICTAVCV